MEKSCQCVLPRGGKQAGKSCSEEDIQKLGEHEGYKERRADGGFGLRMKRAQNFWEEQINVLKVAGETAQKSVGMLRPGGFEKSEY